MRLLMRRGMRSRTFGREQSKLATVGGLVLAQCGGRCTGSPALVPHYAGQVELMTLSDLVGGRRTCPSVISWS